MGANLFRMSQSTEEKHPEFFFCFAFKSLTCFESAVATDVCNFLKV